MEEARAAQLARSPQNMNDPAISRYLVNVQTARERSILYAVLETLPDRDRNNVVYFAADGTVYGNGKESKERASVIGSTVLPPSNPNCPHESGANGSNYCLGPFYRHYSSRNSADTQAQMDITSPCMNSNNNDMYDEPGDAGYTYLGGNTFAGMSNDASATVDAGVQYSNLGLNPTPQEFISYYTTATNKKKTGAGNHYPCKDLLELTWSEPSSTLVSLKVVDLTNSTSETLTMAVSVSDGWGPGCSPESSSGKNCQVKRMVGLAKSDTTLFPDGQNGNPGSYFGVQHPGTGNATATIQETNPEEGTQGGNLTAWSDTEWDSCPKALSGPFAAVLVPNINSTGSESIGLQSQGFSPASSYCTVYGSGS